MYKCIMYFKYLNSNAMTDVIYKPTEFEVLIYKAIVPVDIYVLRCVAYPSTYS